MPTYDLTDGKEPYITITNSTYELVIPKKLIDYYHHMRADPKLSKDPDKLLSSMAKAAKRYKKEIDALDKQRKIHNKKLKLIFDTALKELQQIIKTCNVVDSYIIPASSYSANMNLPVESDFDFILAVKRLDESKLFKLTSCFSLYGYKFPEVRNSDDPRNVHYVLSKIIDNVEIELKIRDYDKSSPVIKLHQKIDKHLSYEKKKIYVFIKFLLKFLGNKESYSAFKTVFYNALFAGIKGRFPMVS
jgi:hypothetical protein